MARPRGQGWLLAAAVPSFVGALWLARDAVTFLAHVGFSPRGDGLYGWGLLAFAAVALGAAVFTCLGQRRAWALLLGAVALVGLTGVLLAVGRQWAGAALVPAAAAVAYALVRGRAALG